MSAEERRMLSMQRNLEKSEQALRSAILLMENGNGLAAMNRLYYTLFYVIAVFTLHHSFSTAKHKQLLGWFNKMFVSTGLIDKAHSKFIFQAFDYRSEADHDNVFTLTDSEVEEHFEQVRDTITVLREFIDTNFTSTPWQPNTTPLP